jgi:polyisoprenoid-binding protein YceI
MGSTAVALVGGPYIYIHFVEGAAPAPLSLATAPPMPTPTVTSSGQTGSGEAGNWQVSDGSLVGYRVKEVLFGQSNVAVGRTGDITGSIAVNGTTITAGTLTVDMATVESDQSRRDGQFNGRIMETATYPTATFTITQPIDLGSIPVEGTEQSYRATGDLTLHGVTKS